MREEQGRRRHLPHPHHQGRRQDQGKASEENDSSHSYEIVELPLPVQNYKATISVAADGDQTKVDWKSTFEAKGASDDDAKKVIDGIFKAGLDNLAKPAAN